MQKLIRRTRPDVTIWFHQHMRLVVQTPGADRTLIKRYATASACRSRPSRTTAAPPRAGPTTERRAPARSSSNWRPAPSRPHLPVVTPGPHWRTTATTSAGEAGHHMAPHPLRRRPQAPDARLRPPPLRPRRLPPAHPEDDRRALHREQQLLERVEHLRRQPARRRAGRAPRRLRALHRRPRRHHPPARPADADVPAHDRPQRLGDRHRARRRLRRAGDGQRPPAPREPAPHALAAERVRDRHAATSSATPSRCRAPSTTSASRRCATAPTATSRRATMRRYRKLL